MEEILFLQCLVPPSILFGQSLLRLPGKPHLTLSINKENPRTHLLQIDLPPNSQFSLSISLYIYNPLFLLKNLSSRSPIPIHICGLSSNPTYDEQHPEVVHRFFLHPLYPSDLLLRPVAFLFSLLIISDPRLILVRKAPLSLSLSVLWPPDKCTVFLPPLLQ